MSHSTRPSIGFPTALLILLCALPSRAQDGPYRVAGTVVDGASGQPLVRAEMTLLRASDEAPLRGRVFTDETGAFQITSEASGVGAESEMTTAAAYRVDAASPNPVTAAQPRVSIRYTVPADRPERPEFMLYDVLGRRVPVGRR